MKNTENNNKHKNNSGQSLAFALIILTVLLTFIPSLVNMLKWETQLSLDHKSGTIAFHLAEAAIERGLWKLRTSRDEWDSVEEGTLSSDYTGGKEFTDIEGGTYKIIITTTTEENERKIVGLGRDSATEDLKAIEVIVEFVGNESALFSPTLVMSGAVAVHWGPIMATGNLTCTGDSFPRKYAVGDIIGRTPPDTDDTEYWAHFPVPDPPPTNTQLYLENADFYYGAACDEQPAPDGGVPINLKDLATPIVAHGDPDMIYYIAGDAELKNNYLKGTLIVMGDLTMGGGSKGEYWADIPEDALDEYAACTNPSDPPDMYGHPGPPAVTQQQFKSGGGCPGKVSFEGFVYIKEDWKGNGGGLVNGCVQCMGDMASLGGNVDIFYNDTVASQVETTELNMQRTSWKQIKAQW
ncbi:hypothetical protein ACFLUV_04735 [Elusimicrobiota bacterium]